MDAAAEWHTQPWKVAGGTKTVWFARYEAVRDARRKKADKLDRDLERIRNAR